MQIKVFKYYFEILFTLVCIYKKTLIHTENQFLKATVLNGMPCKFMTHLIITDTQT